MRKIRQFVPLPLFVGVQVRLRTLSLRGEKCTPSDKERGYQMQWQNLFRKTQAEVLHQE